MTSSASPEGRWPQALRQRHGSHVVLESLSPSNGRIPAFEMRQRRALRGELAVAIGNDADRNIAIGEFIAGKVSGFRQLLVHDRHRRSRPFFRYLNRRVIAFLRRRADETPEKSEDRRTGDAQLPVHPLARESAFAQIGGLKHGGFVLGG